MKKIPSILSVLFLCGFLSACKSTALTENHISKVSSISDAEYILDTLEIDADSVFSIFCMIDGMILYFNYEYPKPEETVLTFYKYDIRLNKTYPIGEIPNPYTFSADYTVNGHKIFFTCNQLITAGSNPDEQIISPLYVIDMDNNNLKKCADDASYQTLIYVDMLDHKIISFKGIVDGDNGITYLDLFDPSHANHKDFTAFLTKKYHYDTKKGEVISNFAVWDSVVYVLVNEYNPRRPTAIRIEKYDSFGNYIGDLRLGKNMAAFLSNQTICEFNIFGKYGFTRDFSGHGMIFEITSDTASAKIINKTELDISVSGDQKNVIFFSRDSGKIWTLNPQTDQLYRLDSPYEKIQFICADNDRKMMIQTNQNFDGETVYADIDQIPAKQVN